MEKNNIKTKNGGGGAKALNVSETKAPLKKKQSQI